MKNILENKLYYTSLKYDVLKNMEVGKAVIKDAVNSWEPLGFFVGIKDEEKREELAIAFSNMARDLIFENERVIKIGNRYDFNCYPPEELKDKPFKLSFSTFVFPILRRVIYGTIYSIDGVDNFNYDKFIDYLEKYSFLAINYDGYDFENCDVEAEFVCIISEAIKNMFNKELKN